jgi:hypothetical protein
VLSAYCQDLTTRFAARAITRRKMPILSNILKKTRYKIALDANI